MGDSISQREREIVTAKQAALNAEVVLPTLKEAVELFMEKIIAGKKSAPAISYRLNRLTDIISNKKIRHVTRQDVIAALDFIAQGQKEKENQPNNWQEKF